MINDSIYIANMTGQQRAWFFAEYRHAAKEEVVGVLLALFLGGFGIHRFYLGQTGAGILYLLFSWSGIPAILGLIECFFMPGRVRAYNAAQAQYIAVGIQASGPPPLTGAGVAPLIPMAHAPVALSCITCGSTVEMGAAFCPNCGAAIAQSS